MVSRKLLKESNQSKQIHNKLKESVNGIFKMDKQAKKSDSPIVLDVETALTIDEDLKCEKSDSPAKSVDTTISKKVTRSMSRSSAKVPEILESLDLVKNCGSKMSIDDEKTGKLYVTKKRKMCNDIYSSTSTKRSPTDNQSSPTNQSFFTSKQSPHLLTPKSNPSIVVEANFSDEFGALAFGLAAKLRKMDDEQRSFCERLINEALFRGELKQLDSNLEIRNCIRHSHINASQVGYDVPASKIRKTEVFKHIPGPKGGKTEIVRFVPTSKISAKEGVKLVPTSKSNREVFKSIPTSKIRDTRVECRVLDSKIIKTEAGRQVPPSKISTAEAVRHVPTLSADKTQVVSCIPVANPNNRVAGKMYAVVDMSTAKIVYRVPKNGGKSVSPGLPSKKHKVKATCKAAVSDVSKTEIISFVPAPKVNKQKDEIEMPDVCIREAKIVSRGAALRGNKKEVKNQVSSSNVTKKQSTNQVPCTNTSRVEIYNTGPPSGKQVLHHVPSSNTIKTEVSSPHPQSNLNGKKNRMSMPSSSVNSQNRNKNKPQRQKKEENPTFSQMIHIIFGSDNKNYKMHDVTYKKYEDGKKCNYVIKF